MPPPQRPLEGRSAAAYRYCAGAHACTPAGSRAAGGCCCGCARALRRGRSTRTSPPCLWPCLSARTSACLHPRAGRQHEAEVRHHIASASCCHTWQVDTHCKHFFCGLPTSMLSAMSPHCTMAQGRASKAAASAHVQACMPQQAHCAQLTDNLHARHFCPQGKPPWQTGTLGVATGHGLASEPVVHRNERAVRRGRAPMVPLMSTGCPVSW